MVVDDDEDMLNFFSKGKEKYSVEVAKDGSGAEKLIKEKEFDLIFLDIVLKDTNGIELYQRLREINPKLQIAFMTSYPEKYAEAKQLFSIQGCLYKSLDIEKIFDFLKNLKQKTS